MKFKVGEKIACYETGDRFEVSVLGYESDINLLRVKISEDDIITVHEKQCRRLRKQIALGQPGTIDRIKEYRAKHGCSLIDAANAIRDNKDLEK